MSKHLVIHIDLNCFFASCEISLNPSLEKLPVVVSFDQDRSIILTANYVARKYGIRAAEPLYLAKRKCRNLINIKPNMGLYKKYSMLFFKILGKNFKKIEKVSIDEAYIYEKIEDFDLKKLQDLQTFLYKKYRLPISIGIGPNPFLAKTATDMKKPLGITILRKKDIKDLLWPMPIESMHMIGKQTYGVLKAMNINTIGDFAHFEDENKLVDLFGPHILNSKNNALGINFDQIYINPDKTKQYGNSTTLFKASSDEIEIKKKLEKMVFTVFTRLQTKNQGAMTFSVTIRYSDFKTYTRTKKMDQFYFKYEDLKKIANTIFDEHYNGNLVRLVGFSASNFEIRTNLYKQTTIYEYLGGYYGN